VEAELNTELRQWLLANEPPANERDRQDFDKQVIALAPGGAGLSAMKENYRQDLRLLMGITGLVLLIACANLANLQLARGGIGGAGIDPSGFGGAALPAHPAGAESKAASWRGSGALGLFVATETAGLLIRMAFHGANYVRSTPCRRCRSWDLRCCSPW